jgi:3-oxoacyl-[acyl-carrier-protein] synthase III
MIGIGRYVPEKVLTNADFEKILDTSDEWITTRTGMKRRHIAGPNEATSDLAIIAARDALERAELGPDQIDCYIVATATPDFLFPATACIVASKLGAAGKAAFDLEIACSGFVYGLSVAASLVRSGMYRRVMLIGAETLSKIVDYTDRSTAVLFADGAGAVILEQAKEDSFLACDLGADGTNTNVLWVPAGGSRAPMDAAAIVARDQYIHMNGKETFKLAVNKMIESINSALSQANLTIGDVDLIVPHQANKRIIDAVAKQMGIPEDKFVINIAEYGNTSAASIPIALYETLEAGRLKAGDVVVFVAFGGGLSWGAVTWRWAA